MHEETLAVPTQKLFRKLTECSWLSDFYLAGGTALALQLGHRTSVDLDFFTEEPFVEDVIVENLARLGKLEILKKERQSVIGILDDVKFSFLGYPYPMLKPALSFLGTQIASVEDIGCMKLDALATASVFWHEDRQPDKNLGFQKIEVKNNTATAIRNVKVEIVSMHPMPSDLGALTFPVNLSPKDKTRTINSQTSGYFDLMTIEIVRGGRKVTLTDEAGATCTFVDDLHKMLGILYNGYALKLVISSSDLQKIEKTCKLTMRPQDGDIYGLAMQEFAYSLSLE